MIEQPNIPTNLNWTYCRTWPLSFEKFLSKFLWYIILSKKLESSWWFRTWSCKVFKNTRAQKCPNHNCTCKLCDTTMLRVVWIPNDAPLSIYFYPFPSLHQYFRYLPPYIQNFSSSIANNGEKITTKTPYQIRHVESKMFWDNTIPIHEEGLTRMVMWWSPPSWAREKVC